MNNFCFETINWSPMIGFEKPDVTGMVKAASKNGFDYISFDIPTIDHFTQSGGELASLAEIIGQSGIQSLAIHSFIIDRDTAAVEESARSAIDKCLALKSKYLNTGITTPVDSDVVKSTERVGAMCREAGIQFAMEFFPFLPINSISATRDLLRAARISGPAILLDSWHFFHGPDNWDTLAQTAPDEIAYVQVSDHVVPVGEDLYDETLNKRLMPGEGGLDLDRFAEGLRQIGYNSIVGPEVLSHTSREMSVDTYAAQAKASTSRFWP